MLYRREQVRRRRIHEKITRGEREVPSGSSPRVDDGSEGLRDRVINFWERVGAKVKPEKPEEIREYQLRFLRAGIRRHNALAILMGAKCFLALVFAAAFLAVKVWFFPILGKLVTTLFALVSALLGFYLPSIWLRLRISRRQEAVRKGLADALDLMVVCVEAGMGLDAAIFRVAEEFRLTNPVLSEELKLVNLEMRAGKLRRDALKNLALRTDLEDVSTLVALLIQTERFGTSIAQALRVQSDAFRTKRFQRAEEKAAKLTVKLVLPLILFIFPALFVVIVGPALVKVLRMFVLK
ncbi:MAG: type II secretion system F family protein [Syntrophobacteraceae bacterium]|nr:type II secretion system F family protein [Syntrophobacteraceae bacterium]